MSSMGVELCYLFVMTLLYILYRGSICVSSRQAITNWFIKHIFCSYLWLMNKCNKIVSTRHLVIGMSNRVRCTSTHYVFCIYLMSINVSKAYDSSEDSSSSSNIELVKNHYLSQWILSKMSQLLDEYRSYSTVGITSKT